MSTLAIGTIIGVAFVVIAFAFPIRAIYKSDWEYHTSSKSSNDDEDWDFMEV